MTIIDIHVWFFHTHSGTHTHTHTHTHTWKYLIFMWLLHNYVCIHFATNTSYIHNTKYPNKPAALRFASADVELVRAASDEATAGAPSVQSMVSELLARLLWFSMCIEHRMISNSVSDTIKHKQPQSNNPLSHQQYPLSTISSQCYVVCCSSHQLTATTAATNTATAGRWYRKTPSWAHTFSQQQRQVTHAARQAATAATATQTGHYLQHAVFLQQTREQSRESKK